MISIITGVPGSGKSFYAVYQIYNEFILKNETSYSFCLTNINKFDYEKSEKLKPFNYDDFYSKLNALYLTYKINQGQDDTDLIVQSKDFDLFNIFIVLDEAHNILSKEDEVLVWWLSYHRHMEQEIFLITQNVSLINKVYYSFGEDFIKALPSVKRFFSNKFKYARYTSAQMYAKDYIAGANTVLSFNQEVFNLYHSGSVSKERKNYALYLVFFAIFFVILFFIGLLALKNLFFGVDVPPSLVDKNNSVMVAPGDQSDSKNKKIDVDDVEKVEKLFFHYIVYCSSTNHCYIDNNYKSFDFELLVFIIYTYNDVYYRVTDEFNDIKKYTLVFTEDAFSMLRLIREKEEISDDEKDKNHFDNSEYLNSKYFGRKSK